MQQKAYCPAVRWNARLVSERFPSFGAVECRAVSGGAEAHVCRHREGHEGGHTCYCGVSWSVMAQPGAAPFRPGQ
jgi:hypothetical protein